MVEKDPEKRSKPLVATFFHLILSQWMIIGIGIVCLLAYFFPDVAKHDGIIRSQYSVLYGAVAVIFLVSGLSIPFEKLLIHLRNWRLHLLVQVTSYLLFPAFMLAVVHAVIAGDTAQKIDRGVLAGFILTSCLPTTIASNVVMTRAAGGDDAAALVEVLIANFLGPFVSPGWTVTLIPHTDEFSPWLSYNQNMGEMYQNVFQQLGVSVLVPLAVGQFIRWKWDNTTARLVQKFYLPKLSTACLLLLIWSSFSTCFATNAFEALTAECIAFTVLFNAAIYLFMTCVCFGMCWCTKSVQPQVTIAVCFCGPAKTTALGIPLVYAMWKTMEPILLATTSLPVLLYTTEQIFLAHFLVYAFRKWLKSKKRVAENSDNLGA